MPIKKLIISGVGCSLVDNIYSNISFDKETFTPYLSKKNGDGGLIPGRLVIKSDFDNFSARNSLQGLENIISKNVDKRNIGGPGVVSMIHAAQLSDANTSEFRFYGQYGKDENGVFILSLLEKTEINTTHYKKEQGKTSSTVVLSDPNFDHGNGERIFVHTLGLSEDYLPNMLDQSFYDSDIVVFGGTAVVPLIHEDLTGLLEKSKSNNCITIVNTVYDFINEKENPNLKWPLGKSDDSYKNIDLLVMDYEEAIRLSGKEDINEAILYFKEKGTGAVVITSGANNVKLFSNGSIFEPLDNVEMPISKAVSDKINTGVFGDTTGCGDNFVGGIIASLASQLQKNEKCDLKEACIWGIISGGTTCFYIGGMYEEKENGQKLKMIKPYYQQYKKQLK